jgi:hypothetical protein
MEFMKETMERIVRVGLTRNVRKVFDEIESVSAEMMRSGWELHESCIEECLGNVHLIFERDIDELCKTR